jgi:inorganic pyrophosphatase
MSNMLSKQTFHAWHGVDPEWQDDTIWGIVEIPKGEKTKYEIDKKSGLIKLDRSLRSSFEYPVNYGFIPQTLGDDGDPLDILIISDIAIQSLCLVRSKVLGVMEMVDQGKKDHKIISIAMSDIRVSHIESLAQLPAYLLSELRHFFNQYTVLENKKVEVDEFLELSPARNIIKLAMDNYNSEFKN